MIGVQNKLVRQLSETIVKGFEQKTGAKVNLTWNSYGDIIGPKYRTNFQGGVKPTVFDAFDRWTGQLRPFLRPMNDFIESSLRRGGTQRQLQWTLPLVDENCGFKDASNIYDLPFALIPQAPILVRRDHFEKAGLDFDQEFPIRDTDHYVEVCKELQAKASIQYPTEVYGKIWDFGDTQLNGWVRSLDSRQRLPQRGLDESTATSEAWLGASSSKSTYSRSTTQLAQHAAEHRRGGGRAADPGPEEHRARRHPQSRHPAREDDGPDADGTVHVGATFPGERRQVGLQTLPLHGHVRDRPPGRARRGDQGAGGLGAGQGVVAAGKPGRPTPRPPACAPAKTCCPSSWAHPTATPRPAPAMIKDKSGVWSNHPRSVDFQYNLLAPHGQKVLQGAPVADELAAYAEEVTRRSRVDPDAHSRLDRGAPTDADRLAGASGR